MNISVIIPTYNEEKYLGKCLDSLFKQVPPPLEIIVVDSYSTDRTVEIASQYTANIYFSKGTAGKSRNLGARKAKGNILVFLDADTIPYDGWLKAIDKTFMDYDIDVMTGPTKSITTEKSRSSYWKLVDAVNQFTIMFGFPMIGARNVAYRRKAFMKFHGFLPNRERSEDYGLSMKMDCKGFFNKDMKVKTSSRRINQEGYTKVILESIIDNLVLNPIGKTFKTYKKVR